MIQGILWVATLGASALTLPSRRVFYRVDSASAEAKSVRDLELEQEMISDQGLYHIWRYEIRPISDIEEVKVWSEQKLLSVISDIENGVPLKPIDVQDPVRGTKLYVDDGIHRLSASRILGFTHIPVLRRTNVWV